MNCFAARQDFPAFWRRELSAERRAALGAHLGQCLKCDQAFRLFAISAPVLHSEQGPDLRAAPAQEFTLESALRRPLADPRANYREPRRWLAMCASALIFLAASTGAYLAVTPPADTLSEALTNPSEPSAQQLFGPDLSELSSDLSG
ncbi:MAG TPA: hypothetical protein VNF27_01115 [Candidatus Binataceae bacterium]|nr:hypothetical protein [Candidatus Binataceae bacterium]